MIFLQDAVVFQKLHALILPHFVQMGYEKIKNIYNLF